MKIVAAKAWLKSLPLTQPYTIAYKVITHTEIVFLEIELANGIKGYGSANPFEEVVGESPAQTCLLLQEQFVSQIIGADIRECFAHIRKWTIVFNTFPGAMAAIDIALHDAFAKYLGISVAALYGQQITALPTSFTIGIKHKQEMLDDAKRLMANGAKVLKIKTGINVEEDIECLANLYEHLDKKIVLRVDANQGYDLQQLQYFIKKTKAYSIELIEQPIPPANDNELLQLNSEERKQLVADEALTNVSAAANLLVSPHKYGIFNIKLMKCGGIAAALSIANMALLQNVHLFWGCNDESCVSIGAALHIALACPNTKYLDLDGSFDLSEDAFKGGFVLRDGYLSITNKPGLGVEPIG